MPTSSQLLAKFAAELALSDVPAAAAERAKDCIIDAVGIAIFGSQLPWGRMVADYARRYGGEGPCALLGFPDTRVHAPCAALANGVFAHAFEHDSFRDPSVGAHPGATVLPAVLAACEETGADGATALTAFVAGCEVLFRVGKAAHQSGTSPERTGFHAPGLTGPYGAAAAAARVYGLDAGQITHALGIAGSLSSGLLAFTKSKQGGNLKRLHMGRTAESGILAARLASAGYTGPETVLDGKFGFLEVFCRDGDPSAFTAGLGDEWETARIGLKRYPCHMSASTAVQAIRELMTQHRFDGSDVQSLVVEGTDKLAHHPHLAEPGDIGQAQYSVPFCVALALFRDPENPRSFDAAALADPAIRALCRSIVIRKGERAWPSAWSTRVIVRLKDGRELTGNGDWVNGMLVKPLSRAELRNKFMLVTDALGTAASARLFDRLEHMESDVRFSV